VSGFDLVMVFAVILFARLGLRLVMKYIKMKKEAREEKDKDPNDNDENQ